MSVAVGYPSEVFLRTIFQVLEEQEEVSELALLKSDPLLVARQQTAVALARELERVVLAAKAARQQVLNQH